MFARPRVSALVSDNARQGFRCAIRRPDKIAKNRQFQVEPHHSRPIFSHSTAGCPPGTVSGKISCASLSPRTEFVNQTTASFVARFARTSARNPGLCPQWDTHSWAGSKPHPKPPGDVQVNQVLTFKILCIPALAGMAEALYRSSVCAAGHGDPCSVFR
jgi:hypothetical protein